MSTIKRRVVLTRPPYHGNSSLAHTHMHTPRSTPLRGGYVAAVCVRAREPEPEGTGSHAHAKDRLLESLMELSLKDRKEILDRAAAAALLETSGDGAERDRVMWTEAVHQALTSAVGSSGGGVVGPGALKRTVAAGVPWEHVSAFMSASRLSELQVVERQRAYNMLAEMLVDHARYVARKSGAPLGAKLVANCASALPGIFDDNFPGYVAAGIAQMVVRSEVRV